MKGSNDPVLIRLSQLPVKSVCISAITLSELRFGIAVSPQQQANQAALDAFLRVIQVSAYPAEAGEDYAKIRADLKVRGTPIGPNDMFIAAHARYLQLTLVTNNTREFERVSGLVVDNRTL